MNIEEALERRRKARAEVDLIRDMAYEIMHGEPAGTRTFIKGRVRDVPQPQEDTRNQE